MSEDRFIAQSVRSEIVRALDGIEREHDVRILLAVESGSRAWGFPSEDSDYDVRFLYVHRMEKYLSIESPRDTIELPLEGALDINGWDLRKALRLLTRSNAVVFEWLTSPMKYREVESITARIRSVAERACFLPAVAYHYDRMARHSFDQVLAIAEAVPLKTYCYALRPCLVLLWMRRHDEAPPMDLSALLGKIVVAEEVRKEIAFLVRRKQGANEQSTTSRIPALDAFIYSVLSEGAARTRLPDRAAELIEADNLFRSIVLGN